jgi:hypothetical protein
MYAQRGCVATCSALAIATGVRLSGMPGNQEKLARTIELSDAGTTVSGSNVVMQEIAAKLQDARCVLVCAF